MINWRYFPKSDEAPQIAVDVVSVFENASTRIESTKHDLNSNDVLAEICDDLQSKGFLVETGKKKSEKILVPVLFGLNGKLEKSFDADAYHKEKGSYLKSKPVGAW